MSHPKGEGKAFSFLEISIVLTCPINRVLSAISEEEFDDVC